jgi:signal peptidase I
MNTLIRPRKPLLALLMSLVSIGFGQIYNGEVNRAIWLFLMYCALGVPGLAVVALYLPSGLMLPALAMDLCLMLALWVYGMADAWRSARRQPDYVPRAWQTSGLYVLVLILCALIVQPQLASYVRNHQIESFRVPSSSNEPTLMHGDFIFADKRYNCPGCTQAVRRGDVAIFTYPNDRTIYYVKRIVGLPGERVQIKGQEILINGRSLTLSETRGVGALRVSEGDEVRRWQVTWSAKESPPAEIDVTVPAGQVYALGDNRDNSIDSRRFGTVPLADVVGRVRQIWFSYADGTISWGRMGKVIE